MKQKSILICVIVFLVNTYLFAQKVSETRFELGVNRMSSPKFKMRWNDDDFPIYPTIRTSKSWYNNDHWVSLSKEVGFNMQYSGIDLAGGGLGAGNHYTGSIISLFADAALLSHFQLSDILVFGIGPETEILIIGKNNLNNSYFNTFCNPPISGDRRIAGLNRDYFNQPAFGLKFSLFETFINEKTTFGFNFSYLWTKNEYSNFYASNYMRISFFVGLRKQK